MVQEIIFKCGKLWKQFKQVFQLSLKIAFWHVSKQEKHTEMPAILYPTHYFWNNNSWKNNTLTEDACTCAFICAHSSKHNPLLLCNCLSPVFINSVLTSWSEELLLKWEMSIIVANSCHQEITSLILSCCFTINKYLLCRD